MKNALEIEQMLWKLEVASLKKIIWKQNLPPPFCSSLRSLHPHAQFCQSSVLPRPIRPPCGFWVGLRVSVLFDCAFMASGPGPALCIAWSSLSLWASSSTPSLSSACVSVGFLPWLVRGSNHYWQLRWTGAEISADLRSVSLSPYPRNDLVCILWT